MSESVEDCWKIGLSSIAMSRPLLTVIVISFTTTMCVLHLTSGSALKMDELKHGQSSSIANNHPYCISAIVIPLASYSQLNFFLISQLF